MIEYEPVQDVVWVEPDAPKTTLGGLHLPDRKGPTSYFNGMGTVLGVGPGKKDGEPMCVKRGDRVLFEIFKENCYKPHDREVCMIKLEQVIAVVRGEPERN